MASAITALTSGGGVSITPDTTGVLELKTNNGTTAVTIDTAQNVGIGATPTQKLDVFGADNQNLIISRNSNNTSSMRIQSNAAASYIVSAGAIPLITDINGAERMRIDSSGNLLVGTTGISTGTFPGIQCVAGGGAGTYLSRHSSGTANRNWNFGMNSADQFQVYGLNTTSFNSGAYIAWGGTSWTASSDERLKDIIEPITDAVNKVSTLRTVIGKYKTDEEGTRRAFLIAQDVQAVLPEAVDASNPEKLGVSYTDVIPLLVASIQELNDKVEAQALEISALKGTA